MSMFARFFGGRAAAARPAVQPSQFAPSMAPANPKAARRELLRAVLRDGLRRHGIPPEWIQGEVLTAASRDREPGVHWRLVVRHWDARLPVLCVALQNSLVQRLYGFDPTAATWFVGVSWQFAVADESACPPLPPPSSWKAASDELPAGDVIAGPAAAPPSGEGADSDVKADLEKLMATLDAQFAGKPSDPRRGYAATEPAQL